MADRSRKGGAIVRASERGERSTDARAGEKRYERGPKGKRYFVPTEELVAAFQDLPRIDYEQFRRDVDSILDQDPTPLFLRADRSRVDRHLGSHRSGNT